MDDDILKTVHSMFGKSVQIVDCEKTSSVQQEEVLLINGIPVSLDGHAGEEIKSSLLTGQMPSVELLNELLYQAGILKQSVQLETSLSVKSSMITTEEVSVERGGEIVDGRTSETKEDYTYSSSKKEIWNPIKATNTNKAATEAMSNTPKVLFESKEPCRPTSSTSISKSSGIFEKDCYPTFDSQHHSNLSCQDVGDNDDDDDDDDDDNDEDGELYVLNPIQYNQSEASTSLSASRQLLNSATNTISSSSTAAVIQSYDILRKCHPDTSQRERKSSSLSIDSGHDGAFHSPSQQAYNNNQSVSTSIQSQLTTNNTDHSISSCYEFTSSDEAEFLTLTNDCTSCLGKYCDSNHPPIKYRGCDDLKQRINLLPNISQSSHDKNAKSPILGTKLSMSSSSCSSKSKPLSSQPKQQNEADSTSISNTVKPSPSYSTTTNQLHPEQPVTSASSSAVSVENGLVFRNGNLLSGPLEALIAHMVPSATYYPDRSFIFSFLLSARLFIRPHELLSRISFIWENQWQQQLSLDVVDEKYTPYSDQHSQQAICGGSSGKLQMFQFTDEQTHHKAIKSAQNCIQLLSEWIDTFPYDFRDERLMQHVRVLARKCVFIDNRLGKRVSSILQQLVQRLTVLEKYEEFLQTLTAKEALEQQQNQTTNEDITASTYQKSLHPSTSHGGGHTNTGYVHAISTSTSQNNDQVDETISKDNSEALRYCSLDSGCSHKTLPSAYTTAPGTCHPNKFANNPHHNHQHHQQLHNFHQSDISSNSVNTVGPGSGIAGLGLGISGCTSSNSSGISCGAELIGICDLCPNAALLAHQLTHIELERLSHIGPEEFVQAFAKENHLESFSDMKKTRNLESYVEWFNRLSYFTATEIVKYPKKKQRVRIIEFWIETARECFNIGNFNSLMAIIAGLNLSPISRLKKTWSKIQSAKFSVLEHQMDPTSNFNSYRSTLKAAMWRSEGATNERERIIIPFFSLLVKDLYFLNEGCSNRLPNGHINFEKFWQLAKQVMEFNTWKKVTCPFEKLPNVIMFLQSSTVFNENTLSIASFECEPPENTQEKGRYKTLKSETKQQQQQT